MGSPFACLQPSYAVAPHILHGSICATPFLTYTLFNLIPQRDGLLYRACLLEEHLDLHFHL
mgnify:CR=1 FL=1